MLQQKLAFWILLADQDNGAAEASMGEHLLEQLLAAVIFSVVGIIVLALAWWIMDKVSPFSFRKEIEEDQNTALAIVAGAVIIGISIIIAAALIG